jgi:hypothetical protein
MFLCFGRCVDNPHSTTPTKTIAVSTSQHDFHHYRIYCTPQVSGTVNPIVKESCWEVKTAFVVVGVVMTETCLACGQTRTSTLSWPGQTLSLRVEHPHWSRPHRMA